MPTLPCPTCQRPVEWGPEARWRPFCSERCRLIDLGAWMTERHAIPGEELTGEPDELGGEAGSATPDDDAIQPRRTRQ